jgi:Domain of unknown function (DUF4410)
VRDFDLSGATAAASDPLNPAYTKKLEEDLAQQSRQIQDYFAETLVESLRKHGYSSSRQQAAANRIVLESVFAEPDKKNRIRRALLGSGATGVKLTLYVGDQKSVNQPLYIEAPVQQPDPITGQ